jgi:glycosyltransferase involved in cell wall biosynthesis
MFWHDLSYLHFPKHISLSARIYYRFFVPKYLKRADHIITFSQSAANEIKNYFKVPGSKVSVSSGAARSIFKPLNDSASAAGRDKYAEGSRYFLYVGSIHPRKNVKAIIQAFELFKEKNGSDLKLLIAGRFAWNFQDVIKCRNESAYKNEIRFLGNLNEGIHELVASAYVMVYPSYYEGFGLPVAESIACHVPVITSLSSSLPEVCGNAGLLIHPESAESIAEAMTRLYNDKHLYAELKQNCIAQSLKLNWDISAEELFDALRKLA